MNDIASATNPGTVVSVRGSFVDVRFNAQLTAQEIAQRVQQAQQQRTAGQAVAA